MEQHDGVTKQTLANQKKATQGRRTDKGGHGGEIARFVEY